MAKISKKQVLSGPSFSNDSLLAWVDSVAKENCRKWVEDQLSDTALKRLKDICNSPLVTDRLPKIKALKDAVDAEQKARSFLLSACGERPPKLIYWSVVGQSLLVCALIAFLLIRLVAK